MGKRWWLLGLLVGALIMASFFPATNVVTPAHASALPVPEPSTLALLTAGLGALVWWRRGR